MKKALYLFFADVTPIVHPLCAWLKAFATRVENPGKIAWVRLGIKPRFPDFQTADTKRLFGSFPQKQQRLLTDHFTSDNPTFAHNPKSMQTIFNFTYFRLFHVLCGTILNKWITDILLRTFPERSKKIGTGLTLWEPSENVLQMLCVSWVTITPHHTSSYKIGHFSFINKPMLNAVVMTVL